jgi:GntR family transcriptional regulator
MKSIPQWVHLVDRLRAMIRSGAFPDDRLPTEPVLAKDLSASRGTVRRALAQLEHEGLIIRKHGSGTYINPAVLTINTRMDEVWDFSEMIRLAGYEPGVQHIETRLEPASPEYGDKLNLDAAAEVIAVANLFLADRRPVIYCLDVIPGHLVRQAYAPEELYGPVYTFLYRRCHQQVSYNIAEVCAVNADEILSGLLKCPLGTALHDFEEIGYNAENEPIIFSQEYYLPDVFCFQAVRRMMSTPGESAYSSANPGGLLASRILPNQEKENP